MGARVFQLLATVALIALVRHACTQAMTRVVQSSGASGFSVAQGLDIHPLYWNACGAGTNGPADLSRCNMGTQSKSILPPQ